MSVNVLRNRVDDDISTMVQRILNVWAHESIVDYDQDAKAMRNRGNFANINQRQGRV